MCRKTQATAENWPCRHPHEMPKAAAAVLSANTAALGLAAFELKYGQVRLSRHFAPVTET